MRGRKDDLAVVDGRRRARGRLARMGGARGESGERACKGCRDRQRGAGDAADTRRPVRAIEDGAPRRLSWDLLPAHGTKCSTAR
jgi:hypothetical protein